jgi:hypothetical protein
LQPGTGGSGRCQNTVTMARAALFHGVTSVENGPYLPRGENRKNNRLIFFL